MPTFLQLTAKDLFERYGNNLSDVAVIFPNNRARLFFSEALYRVAGKPVWSPSYLTISDLFAQHSSLQTADTLELVQLLYETHQAISQKEETFDAFYLWGEILLSDFDDVDKNLANAVQLFQNIKDQGTYTDTLEHLSDEQVQAIRQFFKNFDPDRKTELKRRFLENWNILQTVYQTYKETLMEKGLAYEGMLHRQVAESAKSDGVVAFAHPSYVFVGFNVLNACEKTLFNALNKTGKALFYWDYDASYLHHPRHEAGRFMQENLAQFPNALPTHLFDVFRQPKDIRFVAASTENAGARFIPAWLRQIQTQPAFKPEETTVVLCNEGLLLPVLHSVPDDIRELNVTMGFPLQQTPVCTLVNQLAALHTEGFIPGETPRFNHRYVLPVLQHPLLRMTDSRVEELEQQLQISNNFRPTVELLSQTPLTQVLFSPATNPVELTRCLLSVYEMLGATLNEEDSDSYDPLLAEALFRCHNLTTRLSDILSTRMNELSLITFRKLLQQILSRASIPFSGEPVRGLQIMGLLETRNLDFKNVLMLSVNEGMLPKGSNDVSFIPYNLRKAFGLTTMEHKDSIFAYYFFRLLQRAESITLVYNTSSEGLNRGEMSRFMLQLELESGHPIQHVNLTSGIELASPRSIRVEKTPEIQEMLLQKYNANVSQTAGELSPTALNCLLDCSLRFYFKYLAQLKPPKEITDEVDGAMLGNFFHHAAEYIYTSILLRKTGQPYQQAQVLKAIQTHFLEQNSFKSTEARTIQTQDLEPWIKGTQSVEAVVDLFFKLDFFKLNAEAATPAYNGEQLVRRNLVVHFLKTLLKRDAQRAPFELLGMEVAVSGSVVLNQQLSVTLGGNIDRLDKKEGILRILDYKTGGKPKSPAQLVDLFQPSEDRASHLFQICLYAYILQKRHPELPVLPELLYINRAAKDDYNADITFGNIKNPETLDDFRDAEKAFEDGLKGLLNKLFEPNVPFEQTPYAENCTFCDYKNLCRRVDVKK